MIDMGRSQFHKASMVVDLEGTPDLGLESFPSRTEILLFSCASVFHELLWYVGIPHFLVHRCR
jgi:hypothetical protein